LYFIFKLGIDRYDNHHTMRIIDEDGSYIGARGGVAAAGEEGIDKDDGHD
jgi:hypothetical protein